MGKKFEGLNAIVTGASRGIGAATATRLAAEGANVAITARTVDQHDHLAGSLNETAEKLRSFGGTVVTIAADLSDGDSRARIVPEAVAGFGGPVDILVNNAAGAIYNSMLDYTLKRRRLMFEVNVQAPIDLAQAVIPAMRDAGRGWIVNVSSATARLAEGPPFRTDGVAAKVGVYGATKAALNRATNAFAVELHGTGIRINTVEPRAAVMSEGAEALVGGIVKDEQIESMEAMVESIVALCECDEDRTGKVHVSLDLLDELGITVMTLDGTAPYPGGQRVWRG
jgi:NAD(P)-dependent dehydrogenase (short-subunit alcohol dehydrogenase family)